MWAPKWGSYVLPRRGLRLPYTKSEVSQPIIVSLNFNAYSDCAVRPQPDWDIYRITLVKYPLDKLGKETKVT